MSPDGLLLELLSFVGADQFRRGVSPAPGHRLAPAILSVAQTPAPTHCIL